MADLPFARSTSLALAVLAAVLCSAPVSAQRWEPLPLWGGEVRLAAQPVASSPSIIYATTPGAGIYRSTDRGQTWQFAGPGPHRQSLEILGVDPHDERRLYAVATDDFGNLQGLYRSADGGGHWEGIDEDLFPGAVLGLAFDPRTPGRIYAATNRGLWRSADGGDSWSRSGFARYRVEQVAVPRPGVVLASVLTGDDGTTLRSTDGGASFVEVFDQGVRHYAHDPIRPRRILGSTFNGTIVASEDLGATWTVLSKPAWTLLSLAVTPTSVVLAGTLDQRVWRSLDGGRTWLPPPGTPVPRPPDSIHSLVVLRDRVLAGGLRGVWRGEHDGRGWRFASRGLRAQWVEPLEVGSDGMLWIGVRGNFFTSRDEGETFQPRRAGLFQGGTLERLAVHPLEPAVAYTFECCDVLKTEDHGRSWRVLPYEGVRRDFLVLKVDPVNPDIVYAGGASEPHGSPCPAQRSLDGGESWSCMNPPGTHDLIALAVHPRDPRVLFGVFNSGLYRSADRGASWEQLVPRGALPELEQIEIDPSRPPRLYGRARAGVYRSDNGGRSWRLLLATPHGQVDAIHDLLLDPEQPGGLWVAVEIREGEEMTVATGHVFRSDDEGQSWREVSRGLRPGSIVIDLAADPESADVIYAGTAGQGLYRLRRP